MIVGDITKAQFVVTILSCSVILIPAGGITYGFTSITPYLLSYIKSKNPDHHTTKSEFGWIYALLLFGQACSMIIAGLLERKFSTRKISIVAVLLMNVNLLLMSVACRDVIFLGVTYLCIGMSFGTLYAMTLIVGLSWVAPEYHGLISGSLCLGYGLSSAIISPLQTIFINPNNIAPSVNGTNYIFEDPEVLGNVPNMFLVYAVFSIILQVPLSFLMVKNLILVPKYNSASPGQDVKKMLCTPTFYVLYIMFALNKVPLAYITSYAKFFGEIFIENDMYLSILLGFCGVFNALGRPFWGYIKDKYTVRASLVSLTLSTAICILFSYLSRFLKYGKLGMFVFSIFVWGAFFCCCGNYAIFPAATTYYFGQENLGTKYGILYTSQGVGAVLSAIACSYVPYWYPLVLTIVVFSVVSGLLSCALQDRTEPVTTLLRMDQDKEMYALMEHEEFVGSESENLELKGGIIIIDED